MAYAISLLLIGLSGLLLDLHRRTWQAAQSDSSLSNRDVRFARSQYGRRMQSSGMIGMLGVGVGVWPLIPHAPWPLAIYAACLLGPCLCILLLAGLDVLATRQNFARLRSEQLAAQVKLLRELGREAAGRTDSFVPRQRD